MNIERLKELAIQRVGLRVVVELLAQRGACAADSIRNSTHALIPDYIEEY